MDGLFPTPRFTSFGPSRFSVTEEIHCEAVIGPRPKVLRERLRAICPPRPGVYGMVNAAGELIYVGKAKSLRTRLLSYFRVHSRDPKAGRIIRRTRAILWEHAPSEFAALLRELELIQRWRPAFNVAGVPRHKWRTYVCLGRKPAPYLFVTRRPSAGTAVLYGPVSAGRRTRDAVRWLNDAYRLRDCPQAQEMVFADQSELFPIVRAAGCLRLEIGTCLGPCAAACTRADYAAQADAARGFLEGTDLSELQRLEQAMAAAATELAFERAAVLRDRLESLQGLHEELERLRVARDQLSFVYPVAGHAGEDRWYLVQRGQVLRVVARPPDAASCRAAGEAVREVYHKPTVRLGPPAGAELDTIFLVSAWFRRHAAERNRVLTPEAALACCNGTAISPALGRRRKAGTVRR